MDLREVLADPIFGETVPNLQEMKTVATSAPDVARAVMRLYEAYRKSNERLALVDEALLREPNSGVTTAYEEVRDFFHYADNYIDPLDRAAEVLALQIGPFGPGRLPRMIQHIEAKHAVRVVMSAAPHDRDALSAHDRERGELWVNSRLEPASQFFRLAAHAAGLEQAELIEQVLQGANFKSADAHAIARMGLENYFAGALQMPYAAFLAEAEAQKYDIEELGHVFGATLEQVAHRLSTMQRPRARGVPFFFARVDAAGTITKRHSATALHFARFGGACPLWNVHRAFEAHGQIIRQLAETPDGKRYLCLAWSAEKRIGGYSGASRRYSYALGCEINHAPELVYARGLDLGGGPFDPIGVSCRICQRRNCPQRSVPPLGESISIAPHRRSIVPYEIN
jgi:predicted transcriptional regulator